MGYQVNGNGDGEDGRPQLQMWDDEGNETPIGVLEDDGERWQTLVLVEKISGDLVRGRLSFRLDDIRYDTAPVILEETAARVVQRAGELPKAMLHQLFLSARG